MYKLFNELLYVKKGITSFKKVQVKLDGNKHASKVINKFLFKM
jgi:hypothetical protein